MCAELIAAAKDMIRQIESGKEIAVGRLYIAIQKAEGTYEL